MLKQAARQVRGSNTVRRLLAMKFRQKQSCACLAVLFIGTGKYVEFFSDYHDACERKFLPRTPRKYFAFTDNPARIASSDDGGIVTIHTPPKPWPYQTLFRFKNILFIQDQLQEFSHVLFMDADMLVTSLITEREFFSHDKPLFGVRHPAFVEQPGTFESNPRSLACVGSEADRSTYWQGCLWGGTTRAVLEMARTLHERIEDDLKRGVIAVWHDESHLNKYFIEHRQDVHTLPPDFASPSPSRRIHHLNIGYVTFTLKQKTQVSD